MSWPADHREPVKWVEGVNVFDHGAMVACDQLVEAGFQLRVEDSKQALDSWILKLRGVMKHARLTRYTIPTQGSQYRVNVWEWYTQIRDGSVFIIEVGVLNEVYIDPFATRPGMDDREIRFGNRLNVMNDLEIRFGHRMSIPNGNFSSPFYASPTELWTIPRHQDYGTEITGVADPEELDSRGDVPPTTWT